MKLASWNHNGEDTYGIALDGGLFDAKKAWPQGPKDLLELLQAGKPAINKLAGMAEAAGVLTPLADVKLLAPIAVPPKVIAIAGNYVQHIKESKLDKGLADNPHETTTPRPFLMPATCIANPGDKVDWPAFSKEIDYEAELCIVVGKTCKDVTAEQAADYIAGYTIVNDISARSVTFAEGRSVRPWDEFFDWMAGKWADGFCAVGPWIVTGEEIGDVTDLKIGLTVNGRVRQDASTSMMIFNAFEMVAFLSRIMTLVPGDIIATGTPHGVGMGTGEYLEAGDEMTVKIENIGELTNTLGDRPNDFYKPCN